MEYCDIEWFALETNGDHSVVFEIALKYCILFSFVDSEGYYKLCLVLIVDLNVPIIFKLVSSFVK